MELDLTVDFAERRLRGEVRLQVDPAAGERTLRLDTRQLDIDSVTLDHDAAEARWELGAEDPALGQALSVQLAAGTESVRIVYRTRPEAGALQWLEPAQTAGGGHPFLFTQSQAILARTWIPCQDTPAVRITYSATVRVPPGLLALMSAENPTAPTADGVHSFSMPQPIPSYLLALAVGDLAFRSLGPRSGVYAEPSVVEAAAWEFAEVEDDPDDGMTSIAYDKGAALLRRLEEALGRERWDVFLQQYFAANAFRSVTTELFRESLTNALGETPPTNFDLDQWLFGVGLPDDLPRPDSGAFRAVDGELAEWRQGIAATALVTNGWTTHEWLHFLRQLPDDLQADDLVELDAAFALSTYGVS